LASLTETRHWRALVNMARLYPAFARNLHRYLTQEGDYPYDCRVRTPLGEVAPRLYCHDDLLTLNEIFCRRDYGGATDARVVVDIGANIGISALYFLTRKIAARCYLYEPDPRNVEKLKHNLRDFGGRYRLFECAVADVAGPQRFGIEPTGRYGSLDSWGTEVIRVECRHIDDVLRQCLDVEGHIDLLKIDTEGAELRTVRAIAPELLTRVDRIVLECEESPGLPGFREVVYGSVRRLRRAHPLS
jgi:FkbM family methyltransferase